MRVGMKLAMSEEIGDRSVIGDLHVCITTSASCSSGNAWWHTLIPVFFGAVLGYFLSRIGGRSDRAHEQRRERFERQTLVVQPLDNYLVEAQRVLDGTEAGADQSRWKEAHALWEEGWVRLTPWLDDAELGEGSDRRTARDPERAARVVILAARRGSAAELIP
jgi:hypothetical protein